MNGKAKAGEPVSIIEVSFDKKSRARGGKTSSCGILYCRCARQIVLPRWQRKTFLYLLKPQCEKFIAFDEFQSQKPSKFMLAMNSTRRLNGKREKSSLRSRTSFGVASNLNNLSRIARLNSSAELAIVAAAQLSLSHNSFSMSIMMRHLMIEGLRGTKLYTLYQFWAASSTKMFNCSWHHSMELHSLSKWGTGLHVFYIRNRFMIDNRTGIGFFRLLSLNYRSSGFLRLKTFAGWPQTETKLSRRGLLSWLVPVRKLISMFDNAQEKLPSEITELKYRFGWHSFTSRALFFSFSVCALVPASQQYFRKWIGNVWVREISAFVILKNRIQNSAKNYSDAIDIWKTLEREERMNSSNLRC